MLCLISSPFPTVLQLSYNQLTGSIPTQLGSLKKLSVFSVQSNQLTGAIPASLGDLSSLMRLDLSFNHLFGSIPVRLADLPLLGVLNIQNNTLSGSVPPSMSALPLAPCLFRDYIHRNSLQIHLTIFKAIKEIYTRPCTEVKI